MRARLLMSILFCSGFLVAGEFREKEHLLLYANFETSADPVFAADGTSVDVGSGMNFIAGKKGKGIHFGKTDPETHVRYRLAEPLDNRQEWTIAFYLRPDNPFRHQTVIHGLLPFIHKMFQ